MYKWDGESLGSSMTVAFQNDKMNSKSQFGLKPADAGDSNASQPQTQSEKQTSTGAGITKSNFDRIKTGMTYEQVVKILGKEGEELSSNEFGNIKTVMYKWDGENFSNMNAMFQNGKLNSKSQFGLK